MPSRVTNAVLGVLIGPNIRADNGRSRAPGLTIEAKGLLQRRPLVAGNLGRAYEVEVRRAVLKCQLGHDYVLPKIDDAAGEIIGAAAQALIDGRGDFEKANVLLLQPALNCVEQVKFWLFEEPPSASQRSQIKPPAPRLESGNH